MGQQSNDDLDHENGLSQVVGNDEEQLESTVQVSIGLQTEERGVENDYDKNEVLKPVRHCDLATGDEHERSPSMHCDKKSPPGVQVGTIGDDEVG
jgi:hypothetical protein